MIITFLPHKFLSVKIRVILLVYIIKYIKISSQDFPTIKPIILDEETTLLDIEDNENDFYRITTKHLFWGNNLDNNITFQNEVENNTVIAIYNSDQLLVACSRSYLLAGFDITIKNGYSILEYGRVINYNESLCDISYMEPNVYIIHTQKQEYYIYINLFKKKLQVAGSGTNNGNNVTNKFDKIRNIFPDNFRYISCTAIKILEGYSEDVLIISYVNINEENNKYLYVSKVVDFSPNTSQSVETTIFESQTLLHFKLKRINNTFIRYLIGDQSLEYYLTYKNSEFIFNRVSDNLRNEKLHDFKSYENLFYYNNEYIFHSIPTELETKKNYELFVSNSFVNSELIFIVKNKPIDKISGYYDKANDKFIYIYQYSNIIEYFILESKCLINIWHLDQNNTIICHDYKDSCMSNQYYYHYNTRECVLDNCKANYYRFNFECYIKSCPTNTKSSSVNNYECESNLDYCHIDQNFKTTCFNGLNNEGFQYENTKIYFDSCGDSEYFYNIKTYLYKKVCLRECLLKLIQMILVENVNAYIINTI